MQEMWTREVELMRKWTEDYEPNEYERHLLQRANLPEYRWIEEDLIPQTCDEEAYSRLARIRSELSNFEQVEKNNILICGNHLGCGKTSWAYKLLLTHIENNWKKIYAEDFDITDKQFDIAFFLSAVPFLIEVKQFGSKKNEELYNRAKSTDFLVLDDIAAVNMSNYDYNVLYAVIESRMIAHKPIVMTSNCTSYEEMNKIFGSRLAERIWANSKVIELKGEGMRM